MLRYKVLDERLSCLLAHEFAVVLTFLLKRMRTRQAVLLVANSRNSTLSWMRKRREVD
jgi:hypothetical protein